MRLFLSLWCDDRRPVVFFYSAMHYNAKRGLAIACPPSVWPSVRLSATLVDQDHICWKSWKLLARPMSPTHSLFAAQRSSTYSKGNMGRLEVGWENGVLEQKSGNISETRKDRGTLLWRASWNSLTLFRTVPYPIPYGLLFPKIGGLQPPPGPKLQSLLSQERVKLRTSNLFGTYTGSIRIKAR